MKLFASLLVASSTAIAAPAFADSNSTLPSQAQRIANFLGTGAPTFCQQLPMPAISSSTVSPTFSWNSSNPNFGSSPSNFSSFFDELSAGCADHHFDSTALSNLQMFIDNLHLPPDVVSKIQMFVQELENHNFQVDGDHPDSNNDGDNDNAENDNDQGDEHGDMDEEQPVA